MKTLILLTALAIGCGAAPETAEPAAYVSPTTFAPAEGLVAYTEAATVRVARATGRDDVAVEPDGIPVLVQDYLHDKDGNDACGLTVGKAYPDALDVVFDLTVLIASAPPDGCPPVHVTVLHEMIHALSPGSEHSEAGVYEAHGAGSQLEETSLEALCGGFECKTFVPERSR